MIKKGVKIAKFRDLLKIKTIENNEEMVNISKLLKKCICVYKQNDMFPYVGKDLWARKTIANKLQNVSNKLTSKFPDYKIKIVYGYRHPDIQKKYFKKRRLINKKIYPKLSILELNELTHKEVAFPEVAGHPTGGAIDITISKFGKNLDMGTDIANFFDTEKIKTFSKNITSKQKENRKLLHDLMVSENFAPFYGEWWHFSYGDKEWAWFYNKNNAIYDQIDFQLKKL